MHKAVTASKRTLAVVRPDARVPIENRAQVGAERATTEWNHTPWDLRSVPQGSEAFRCHTFGNIGERSSLEWMLATLQRRIVRLDVRALRCPSGCLVLGDV